jgi:arylsulfatase
MATCIEAAGTTYPGHREDKPLKPLAGESFLDTLRGRKWERVQPIIWEHEGNQALRAGEWKLVRKYNQPWELYNFEEDRTELVDRSDRESPRLKRMQREYEFLAEKHDIRDWDSVKEVARSIYPGIV